MKVELMMYYTSLILSKTTKKVEIKEIGILMSDFFYNKKYSDKVLKYTIDLTCIGVDWDEKMVCRPKYYSDKIIYPPKGMEMCEPVRIIKEFDCGVALDKSFAYTTKQEGYNMIARAVLDYLENLKYPVAIRKSFDKERFNSDMREFFRGIGCDV